MKLDTLSYDQLAKIAGGSDYTYGSMPKFNVGDSVKVYIADTSFWNAITATLFAYDMSEKYKGTVTMLASSGGKWVYTIVDEIGKAHDHVDEQYMRRP